MIFKKLLQFQCKTIHKGFTLAEVMTVLGLLGVLAAILIPTIINNAMPNTNKVMFKKAYHSLEQAISIMINDDINYPGEATFSISGVDWPRGFNYTNATTNGAQNKFCYFLYDKLNTISGGPAVCPASTGITDSQGAIASTKVTTSDGMDWYVYIPVSDDFNINSQTESNADELTVQFPLISTLSTTRVIIDVDGSGKGFNCTTDSDTGVNAYLPTGYDVCNEEEGEEPDTFIINVRYDGKLRAGCSPNECTATTDQTAVDILSAPMENQ